MSLRFDQPLPLDLLWLAAGWVALAAIIVAMGLASLRTLDPVRRWTAMGVRLAVLALIFLILAGPQFRRQNTDLTVALVLDVSQSVSRGLPAPGGAPNAEAASENWVRQWLDRNARQRRDNDRLAVVTFDGTARVRSHPASSLDLDSGAVRQPVEGTDPAAAIRLGLSLLPADAGRRLLLPWDGNATVPMDEVLAAAREARAAGVRIDVLPIEYQLDREVLVDKIVAPMEARVGQTIPVRILLHATHPARGTLFLKLNGRTVDLDPAAAGVGATVGPGDWSRLDATAAGDGAATAPAGDTGSAAGRPRYQYVRDYPVPVDRDGVGRFEAVFEPGAGEDLQPGNNLAQAFTIVQGKGRVLVAAGGLDAPYQILPESLRAHGIAADLSAAAGVPDDLVDLQRFDAVLLHNVPARAFSPKQQEALVRYVNDLGGGLVMIGGPESFGAGGWQRSPVARVLPVDCHPPSDTVMPVGALAIVLDRSGSMTSPAADQPAVNKLDAAKEAAVKAVEALDAQDFISVTAFDTAAWEIVPLQTAANAGDAIRRIRKIEPGGGTNIRAGLEAGVEALSKLERHQAAVKHVILLTDGQDPHAFRDYHKVLKSMAESGISLSTVGVGPDINEILLKQLAEHLGGQFHKVTDPSQLPQIFIKEARTIARKLLKETPFEPRLVATGSPIMAGLQRVPVLNGLVVTWPRNDARIYLPLLGPEGEPVFAHWQAGLGRVAAFTSDATNRWATEWLAQGTFADFWGRTMRAIARPPANRAYDLSASIRGDTLHLRLDATTPRDSGGATPARAAFANLLDVAGVVVKPDGGSQTVQLAQTGPGIYEAALPASAAGDYIVSLFVGGGDQERAQPVFGGVSKAAGGELRSFASNRGNIEQVAALTGGRVLDAGQTDPAAVFSREGLAAVFSVRPIWWGLLMVLLGLFLLDVANRRLAWGWAEIQAWALGRLDAMAGVFRSRPVQAEVTLAALKERAAATERRLTTPPAAATAAPQMTTPAAPTDAAPAVTARMQPAPPADRTADNHAPAPMAGGMTSRLLDLKRRTRQERDGEGR